MQFTMFATKRCANISNYEHLLTIEVGAERQYCCLRQKYVNVAFIAWQTIKLLSIQKFPMTEQFLQFDKQFSSCIQAGSVFHFRVF